MCHTPAEGQASLPTPRTSTTTLQTTIGHNITESGDAYAIPDFSKNKVQVDIEDDEKYEETDDEYYEAKEDSSDEAKDNIALLGEAGWARRGV